MNHTARLATPVHWAHCLNPSPFLVRVALKWRLFPRLSLYKVKEVMKPCLFVYLLAIHVLKTYPTGKLEDKSAQLKGSHQNYTNLDLLFLHRPTRQCTVGLSGKDTPVMHCPMHVGIYIYIPLQARAVLLIRPHISFPEAALLYQLTVTKATKKVTNVTIRFLTNSDKPRPYCRLSVDQTALHHLTKRPSTCLFTRLS